jgi:hypothetical protein
VGLAYGKSAEEVLQIYKWANGEMSEMPPCEPNKPIWLTSLAVDDRVVCICHISNPYPSIWL